MTQLEAVRFEPFTIDHFERYASLFVFDDGERRGLEDWQLMLVEDLFRGYRRNLWIIPEGNGKSTLLSIVALYGADYSDSPWIPIGASSAKQARIIHDQATGFITRTPGLTARFKSFGGYKSIRVLNTRARRERGWGQGTGIEVFAADAGTGDGVIPYPYALADELHRTDMRLFNLWAGKLRKRGSQIVGISTAGEPNSPFETYRDKVRRRAADKKYTGMHLRAAAANEVMHEWMVEKDEDCDKPAVVKAANPLSTITEATLREDLELADDMGDWKRLKCNRPTRATKSAISDREWDAAQVETTVAHGVEIDLGIDIAFKWDTTAIVPLWSGPQFQLLGEARILVPPRDGSAMHPDVIKDAILALKSDYRIVGVVMDLSKAEDVAAWIEDELGVTVIDHPQGNAQHCKDYEAFMKGLRTGKLKHTGDEGLKTHALNAIARRLPGGDYRFDRPSAVRNTPGLQDRRVIDALTAAAAVVEESSRTHTPKRSVYEDRGVIAA